jgi:NADH-quinone oxidoreductase subunit J
LTASQVIFYIIAAFILGTGFLAVTTRKIFRSAIWLLFSLIGIAGLFFWMDLQFIAAVQITVYVGGIVVLIIFSIFLTQESGKEMKKPLGIPAIIALVAVLLGFLFSFRLLAEYHFLPGDNKPFNPSVRNIGNQLLSTAENGYALPFEAVSILLLAAMIGCIVIAMKSPAGGKPGG